MAREMGFGAVVAIAILAAACSEPAPPARGADRVVLSSNLVDLANGAPAAPGALRGPLVVNLWASWCASCRAEMPALERLSRRLAGDGIRVLGVTLDEDRNLARELVRSAGVTFATYAPVERREVLARVKALPHTIVVDARGTVAAELPGARDWDDPRLESRVRAALDR